MEGGANPNFQRKGIFAAFILGLLFGIALGPCTFAYMATMLGVVFNIASTKIVFAVSLLLAYGIGHCAVIVFAGTFTEVIQHYLNWSEKSKGAVILKKICGALVIMGGIYMIGLNII
jgi:cytochrome c-type biogenesis protein